MLDYSTIYSKQTMDSSDGKLSYAQGMLKFGDALAAIGYAYGIHYDKLTSEFPEVAFDNRFENVYRDSKTNSFVSKYTVQHQINFIKNNYTRIPKNILEIGGGRLEVVTFLAELSRQLNVAQTIVVVEPGEYAPSYLVETARKLFPRTCSILPVVNLINKPLHQVKDIDLSSIKDEFCFLFVGHWMNGSLGHDRKNVGFLIKAFLETFKNKIGKKPALILKSSIGSNSYSSREEILKRINKIKSSVPSKNLPNIYLLSGEFSDVEMNQLYNHPKVKSMISLTKGEGYGRPLLEFTATGKPIIASGWSGPVDFLQPDKSFLLPGKLAKVDKSAANKWLLESSEWFFPEEGVVGGVMKDMFKHYKKYLEGSKKQKYYCKKNFSFEKMTGLLNTYLENYTPDFPKQIELNLPTLEKID